jgi:hypothetical protein
MLRNRVILKLWLFRITSFFLLLMIQEGVQLSDGFFKSVLLRGMLLFLFLKP